MGDCPGLPHVNFTGFSNRERIYVSNIRGVGVKAMSKEYSIVLISESVCVSARLIVLKNVIISMSMTVLITS
jgi:hypothetical protein